MARKTTLRATTVEVRKMECGKHQRPSNILEEPPCYRMPRLEKRYRRKLLRGETRGSCICDYYDFPQLRQERLDVNSEDKAQKKPFPFLKLPAEIRNQIYEEIFVAKEAIEFCPEPFFFRGDRHGRHEKGDWQDDFDSAAAYHRNWKVENVGCYASLLRANKQICAEATPILYGENEFRFSNMTGWIALEVFLFTIGLHKSAMLRKIAVSHPDALFLPTSKTKVCDFMVGSLYMKLWESKEPGFVRDGRWFEDPISTDPALVLQKAGKLQQLHLISPASSHQSITENPFDLTCFENLDFTLISLRSEKRQIQEVPYRYKAANAAEAMAEQHFQETGEKWNFLDKVIDENGRY